jgi:biopolymer transport protein ExbD
MRIGQGLVGVAPWLNLALLVLFFVTLDAKLVLQPGVVMELPKTPLTGGARMGLTAVLLSIPGTEPGAREEIVFFDDQRYMMKHEEQKRALKEALAEKARGRGRGGLAIQADRRVSHGTVVEVVNMAIEVGIQKVNLATRPF